MAGVSFSHFADNWFPAISDLYSITFSETSLNVLPAGGTIGNVFPATSVQEPIYSLEYEEVRLVSGLTLPFIARIS